MLWLAATLLEVFRGLKAARSCSTHCWKSNVRELLCHAGYIAMWCLGEGALAALLDAFRSERSSTDGFWACGYLWSATASVVVPERNLKSIKSGAKSMENR